MGMMAYRKVDSAWPYKIFVKNRSGVAVTADSAPKVYFEDADGAALTNATFVEDGTISGKYRVKVSFASATFPVDTFVSSEIEVVVGGETERYPYDKFVMTEADVDSLSGQIGGIGSGGSAAQNFPVSNDNVISPINSVTFVGTQDAGTYATTERDPDTYHTIGDTTNAIDYVQEVDVGATRIATQIVIDGYLSSSNDSIPIQVYDHIGTSWETFETLAGQNGTANKEIVLDLFSKHTGAIGTANQGLVWIRYVCTGQTTPTLSIARVVTSAVASSVAQYEEGAIWLDSGVSNTGTTEGVDGVPLNSVSTIAAANTLLGSTGLHKIKYAPGTSVTFSAAQTDEIHDGRDYSIALGGQDITGSFFFGCTNVSGVCTSAGGYEFEECDLYAVTMPAGAHHERVGLHDTFTVGSAGIFTFHDCYTDSSSAITIDFGAFGATDIHLLNFHGEVVFANMAAGDTVHITGAGTITTATCTGGTVDHDGAFQYTDSGGNVTELKDDISTNVSSVLTQTGTTGVLLSSTATSAQLVDDIWDEVITKAAHDAANSAAKYLRLIKQGSSTTESAVNDPGAAATTTVFNTDLTEVDDFWNDMVIVFTTGSLVGQAKPIQDFSNTNGTITLDEALTAAPSDNDEFVIISTHVHPVSQISAGVLDEVVSGHLTAGTLGKYINNLNTGVNITSLNSDTDAASRLALSAKAIVPGTVDTVTNGHTPTTTVFQSDDITEATTSHYVGRIIMFKSGALNEQVTSITSYSLVGGIGQFTVDAMTEAPANDDTFIII